MNWMWIIGGGIALFSLLIVYMVYACCVAAGRADDQIDEEYAEMKERMNVVE